MKFWAGLLALLALGGSALAASPREAFFGYAWRLVQERYWDRAYHGVDWVEIGKVYRQRLAEAQNWDQMYQLLDQMYRELGDDHSTFLSPEKAELYLAGGRCLRLPFAEAWEDQALSRALAASEQTATKPGPEPPGSNGSRAPAQETTASAFAPIRVELKDGLVLIKLTNLVEPSAPRLEAAIRLYDAKAKGYILDLRGNPGGLAYRMAEVAGLFMRGLPWRIVTRGFGVTPQPTLPTPFGKPLTQKPLVVLVDGGVNSAAEGLAGALQNAGRAYVIGEKTAGNTEVLVPYCFPGGSVALLASGVLAPLAGPTWEGRGVTPDLEVKGASAQLEAAMRYLKNLRK